MSDSTKHQSFLPELKTLANITGDKIWSPHKQVEHLLIIPDQHDGDSPKLTLTTHIPMYNKRDQNKINILSIYINCFQEIRRIFT